MQVCVIRQAIQLVCMYTCIRVSAKLGIHPLISTDFHNVDLAIQNELTDTLLLTDDNDESIVACT